MAHVYPRTIASVMPIMWVHNVKRPFASISKQPMLKAVPVMAHVSRPIFAPAKLVFTAPNVKVITAMVLALTMPWFVPITAIASIQINACAIMDMLVNFATCQYALPNLPQTHQFATIVTAHAQVQTIATAMSVTWAAIAPYPFAILFQQMPHMFAPI